MPTKPDTAERAKTKDDVVAAIRDLSVHFELGGSAFGRLLGRSTGTVKAVDGIDLTLHRGEVVGLVGESGSGKSTLGRALLGLVSATNGSIQFEGDELTSMSNRQLRDLRQHVQMVFQDPNAALNPAMTIEQAVEDPLRIHGVRSKDERRRRVVDTLERVGLSPVELFLPKYPRDLSGGQKQRVVIARSIIMGPSLLVADEPISMLDMSVRAKILQLMLDLKEQLDLTYVYITHDLASAKFFCDRIAIMYLGRIVELGPTETIFADPKHPYTKALLAAIPDPDPSRKVPKDLLRGEIPDAARPPLGCSFHPRCPAAFEKCGWEARDLAAQFETHWLSVDASEFDAERGKIGNLDGLRDEAEHEFQVKPGRSTHVAEVSKLLDDMQRERPDDRIWTAVEEIKESDGAVNVRMTPGTDPELRWTAGAEVACHLY